jgi:ribosomal protein S18 acetylase RimI-like enzyme
VVYSEPYLALEPGTARLLLDDEEVTELARMLVDPRNQRAAAFYRRLGFRPLGSRDGTDLWGRRLTSRG